MGAVDHLSLADADDVVAALLASGTEKSELPVNPMSADRVRWEHIQRIYEMCNRNVSGNRTPAEHAATSRGCCGGWIICTGSASPRSG